MLRGGGREKEEIRKEGEAGSKTRQRERERGSYKCMLVTFELIFKGSTCCLRELDLARYLFLYGEQGFFNNGFP